MSLVPQLGQNTTAHCPKADACWRKLGILPEPRTGADFSPLFFGVLDTLVGDRGMYWVVHDFIEHMDNSKPAGMGRSKG